MKVGQVESNNSLRIYTLVKVRIVLVNFKAIAILVLSGDASQMDAVVPHRVQGGRDQLVAHTSGTIMKIVMLKPIKKH